MTRLLFLFTVLLGMQQTHAQNLLANGGFEERNTCTELHANCAPEGWFRIPLSPVSNSKGTAGFFLGDQHENVVMDNTLRPGFYRSYIYTRLLCPLEKDKDYIFTASFKIPEREKFEYIDLLWLNFEPYRYQSKLSLRKEHTTITLQNKTSDKEQGWKEYRIRFTATGDEQYLVIGNFNKDFFPAKSKKTSLIVYEIDDVSLLPADSSVQSCPERNINKQVLYNNNYRHTPGKFIDEPQPKPSATIVTQTPAQLRKDSVQIIPPIAFVIPPTVNDTLIVPDVLFKFDKSELNPAFAYRLDTLVDKIKNRLFKRIEILGHTDNYGKDDYNQRLSINRAVTVKNYLAHRLHYKGDAIITKGFAATMPVATNATAEGRQRNRRVEIVLVR